MGTEQELQACLQAITSTDCDVIAYIGPVDRSGYEQLCDALKGTRRLNCLLVLCTFGGDPNAGYRIARALSHNYPKGQIRVLVPDYCKSAGTLICIGANELIISDKGELGPLDIQVQKPDEMFQRGSGLDIIRGLQYLQDAVLGTFRNYLVDINQGSGLSTRSASEIASKLTIGIHEPIFAQIDPIRLGEMQAALTIALDYGSRLNARTSNLKPAALHKLASGYPSHGFVIDRKEARDLFVNVRMPNEHESVVGDAVSVLFGQEARSNASRVIDCFPNSTGASAPENISEDVSDASFTTSAEAELEPSQQEQLPDPGASSAERESTH